MVASAMTFASCNYDELNDALEHAIERSWYGNWCGPMHGAEPDAAIDSLDELCKTHDECYYNKNIAGDQYYNCVPGIKVTDCDTPFVTGMKGLPDDVKAWPTPPPLGMEDEAAQFRIDAIKLFGGCVDLFP